MLVLTRRIGEEVILPELNVRLQLVGLSATAARIGISAPASVRILRRELLPPAGSLPGELAPGASAAGVDVPT